MSGVVASPSGYVVDASVAIKLFVVESLSDRAEAFFRFTAGPPALQLVVPDLFYSECANILWKYVRRVGYALAVAQQDLRDLRALDLLSVPTNQLVDEALPLAMAHDITVYDACYVALARQLDLALVTADEALVRKVHPSVANVRWLGDSTLLPPPARQSSS